MSAFGVIHAIWMRRFVLGVVDAGAARGRAVAYCGDDVGGCGMLHDRLSVPDQPRWRLPALFHLLDVHPVLATRLGAVSHD